MSRVRFDGVELRSTNAEPTQQAAKEESAAEGTVSTGVEPLAKRQCVACVKKGGDLQLLAHDAVLKGMQDLDPLWVLDGGKTSFHCNHVCAGHQAISRKFVAKNFQSALDYISAVGAVAEEAGHHPDLHLTEYRTVEVRLSTHDRGGITINDLIVAAKIDEVRATYSPKFLREHPHMTAAKANSTVHVRPTATADDASATALGTPKT